MIRIAYLSLALPARPPENKSGTLPHHASEPARRTRLRGRRKGDPALFHYPNSTTRTPLISAASLSRASNVARLASRLIADARCSASGVANLVEKSRTSRKASSKSAPLSAYDLQLAQIRSKSSRAVRAPSFVSAFIRTPRETTALNSSDAKLLTTAPVDITSQRRLAFSECASSITTARMNDVSR